MPPPRDLVRVYDDHAQALFAFLLNLTRHEADTRDILQQLFARLAAREGLPPDLYDERGYLLHVAHNLAIDLFRRRGARERTLDRLEPELQLFAPAAHPDEAALRARLAAALGEIPPEQRTVVHLKLWEGLTFEQIATLLGIPLNTAAGRYRYGIDKLRARLRPLYDEMQDSRDPTNSPP
jgi:RNA polymerase sigma-70 factor (ECF subfamily)